MVWRISGLIYKNMTKDKTSLHCGSFEEMYVSCHLLTLWIALNSLNTIFFLYTYPSINGQEGGLLKKCAKCFSFDHANQHFPNERKKLKYCLSIGNIWHDGWTKYGPITTQKMTRLLNYRSTDWRKWPVTDDGKAMFIWAHKLKAGKCYTAIVISIPTVIQIHIQKQIPAASVVSDSNGLLISDYGSWRHKERDTILKSLCKPYYADSTPTRGASCDV